MFLQQQLKWSPKEGNKKQIKKVSIVGDTRTKTILFQLQLAKSMKIELDLILNSLDFIAAVSFLFSFFDF